MYLFGQFGDGFSVLALEYLGGIHALGDKDVELAWVWSAWYDIQQCDIASARDYELRYTEGLRHQLPLCVGRCHIKKLRSGMGTDIVQLRGMVGKGADASEDAGWRITGYFKKLFPVPSEELLEGGVVSCPNAQISAGHRHVSEMPAASVRALTASAHEPSTRAFCAANSASVSTPAFRSSASLRSSSATDEGSDDAACSTG